MKNILKYPSINLIYQICYGFYLKDGFQKASALAYGFLMSFVPFLISLASIITIFIPPKVYVHYEKQLITNYFPVVGKQIAKYILNFQHHALDLSIISLTVFFATSLLMINTLRYCMDQLLGFNENDLHIGLKLVLVLAIFAGLISSSLVLLGMHEAVTHYLPRYALNKYAGVINLLQYLSSFLAFSVVYKFVPHSKIDFKHAAIGGVVAAIFFELAKFGFAIYIRSFSNNQYVLYGSLAAIPIFLFWLYIISIIVLLGAQIIAVLRELPPEFFGDR